MDLPNLDLDAFLPNRVALIKQNDPKSYWSYLHPTCCGVLTFSASLLLIRRWRTSMLLAGASAAPAKVYGDYQLAKMSLDEHFKNQQRLRGVSFEETVDKVLKKQEYMDMRSREANFARSEQSIKMQNYVDRKLKENEEK